MKIYFLNSAAQSEKTISKQIIDGKLYYWVVYAETLKINESLDEWVERKKEYLNRRNILFDGIGIYEFSRHQLAPPYENNFGVIIRYAVLKNSITT